jgi:hypothetical protein
VEGDEDTMIIGTMIILGIAVGLFIYFGYLLSKEQNFMYYVSWLFWYLALLVPLFGIRIIANSDEIVASHKLVLNSLYRIYLSVYMFMVVVLVVYFIIMFITWLYNYRKTPKWQRLKY